jgi:predicted esterase
MTIVYEDTLNLTNNLRLFHHLHIDNHASKTLFLLHGTGADERDLLPLVTGLEDKYNLVSLLGNVREHGMARFFARDEQGVFDQESIAIEAKKLAQFIETWNNIHNLKSSDTAFLGYSNGANMIAALTLTFPKLVTKAALLHPMLPFEPKAIDLSHQQYFVSYGEHDQMILAAKAKTLIATLETMGAQVDVFHHDGGHEIWPEEVAALKRVLSIA